MRQKYTDSQVIAKVKELARELGRRPRYIDCSAAGISERSIFKLGGLPAILDNENIMVDESKRLEPKQEAGLVRKYQSLCAKKEQIQGFFRHEIDLDELFKRAGNPKVLKLSAQPDTHVKFRDHAAVNCYLKFLEYYQPDVHLILGDFADCEGLSHWPSSDMEPRRIVPEMKEARALLGEIVKATPKCSTRIMTQGNHEAWIDQALGKMPELFDGLADLGLDITVEKLLGLQTFGYEMFPLNHLVKIGHAHFTHGIYTGGNHSKKHLDVFKANLFFGHMHDTQSHNQTSVQGPMDAQSLGCLCRLDAKFLRGRPNNWSHAHGIFEFFPDGTFTYMVPKIINGRMSFNGQVFDGN